MKDNKLTSQDITDLARIQKKINPLSAADEVRKAELKKKLLG